MNPCVTSLHMQWRAPPGLPHPPPEGYPLPFSPPPGLPPWWWYKDLGEYECVNPSPPPRGSPGFRQRVTFQLDFECRLCGGRKIAVEGIHKYSFCWRCCHRSMPRPGQTMFSAIHNAGLPGMPGRLRVWCRQVDELFCEDFQEYSEVVDRASRHITLQYSLVASQS